MTVSPARPLLALAVVASAGALLIYPSAPAQATPPAKAAYKIDGVHSAVLFRVVHAGVGASWGRFNDVSGTVHYSAGDPAATAIDVTIAAKSVDTANAKRDEHLRGPDFFNVKQHPTLRFKSTKVSGTGDALEVTGDLTLLGTTKQVRFRAKKVGEKALGERFGYRAGFEAELTIQRSAFGMTYGVKKGMLGDDVRLIISLECVRQ